jgi:hypothetical protein
MIGEWVPEDNPFYENFLVLLEIMDFVFAPKATLAQSALLQQQIMLHHSRFKELYPSQQVTPKMHYNIHIPQWLLRLVEWCMHV